MGPEPELSKRMLRRDLLLVRTGLTPDDVRRTTGALAGRALDLAELAQARTVAAYVSVGSEPGTRALLDARTLENARLLVSELVANAIEHVREEGEIELRVSPAGGILRVEVLDPGPGFTPRQRSPDSDRGWGLQYVDRLAASWGVDSEDERSRVWFELLSET